MSAYSSGLYGVFRLDDDTIDRRDLEAMGFAPPLEAASAYIEGRDSQGAVHRCDVGGETLLLVGDIHAPDALAERLGLSRAVPPARLALAALTKFREDTPIAMIGEYSLLHWSADRQLTLMSSAARRDRIFFAVSGARCAVASDLVRLGRLNWVDDAIDECGFLYAVGRTDVRAGTGNRTMLGGVSQLQPGESVVVTMAGARLSSPDILPAQPRWTGSFADAMAEAEAVFRRVIRDRLAHTASPAVLLSGGLDSSLIAWGAAEERSEGQRLRLLTSVAPPGSGLPDERPFADIVAASLGLETDPVWPASAANMYRPPDHVLGGASGPILANRHALTDGFHHTARQLGATLLVNGTFGEFSFTGSQSLESWRGRVRRMIGQAIGEQAYRSDAAFSPFHIRLAPHRLANLPEPIRSAAARKHRATPRLRRRDCWGYVPGAEKALAHPNEFYPGALRMDFPFRDVRILRLFAGFPLSFFREDGLQRAPARRVLRGRLPDAIRLRTSGMPASPDHMTRLRQQAPEARNRIAEFRNAQVDEWLDLDWLDQALGRVGVEGASGYAEANEVQMTAIVAEFLTWWRMRR